VIDSGTAPLYYEQGLPFRAGLVNSVHFRLIGVVVGQDP